MAQLELQFDHLSQDRREELTRHREQLQSRKGDELFAYLTREMGMSTDRLQAGYRKMPGDTGDGGRPYIKFHEYVENYVSPSLIAEIDEMLNGTATTFSQAREVIHKRQAETWHRLRNATGNRGRPRRAR